MTPSPPVLPTAADPVETQADWLEWRALDSRGKLVSWSEHQSDLGIGGSDETSTDLDNGAPFETLIDDIASELTEREQACGNSYPFEITRNGLAHRTSARPSVYEFLLLLTLFGGTTTPTGIHGVQLFEDLCAEALTSYLGNAQKKVFGFPRRLEPKGFAPAVDRLCRELGEGGQHRSVPRVQQLKDAHLDLVAWRGFPDRRPGQLIIFGQCATGEHWFDKIHELRPREWCCLWMHEQPWVTPVASLFVPRRVERDLLPEAGIYGGVLFDRCRIAWLLPRLPVALEDTTLHWMTHVWKEAGS